MAAGNRIVEENQLPGSPSNEWDVNGAGDPTIVGFATPLSVNSGGTVRFKVRTDAAEYRLDIYRLGYYGGHGARKVASLKPSVPLPQIQPEPVRDETTGLVDCGNWSESVTWEVPVDATSGLYIGRLVRPEEQLRWRVDNSQAGALDWIPGASAPEGISKRAEAHGLDDCERPPSASHAYGSSLYSALRNKLSEPRASHIYFVVRQDHSHALIVLQTSDTCWQAYNSFGGTSLYGSFGTVHDSPAQPRAYVASYNRPIVTRDYRSINAPFGAEYPLIRWIEKNGYDVTYQTGLDTHISGIGTNQRIFISSGHDEYWSGPQRDYVEAARDRGVSLVFFSGNEMFWRVRWEKSEADSSAGLSTMVCYKESQASRKIDPKHDEWTGTFRDWRAINPLGAQPENAITGTMYMVDTWPNYPIIVPRCFSQHRFWRNTCVADMSGDQVLLLKGIIGHEFDEDIDNGFRPVGLARLSETVIDNVVCLQDQGATFDSGTAVHHLVLYRASSGALVFGAGTCQWAWGLDGNHDAPGGVPPKLANPYNIRIGLDPCAPDRTVQQATVNLFADMGVQPATLESGLVHAEPPARCGTPPVSSVNSFELQMGQLCILGDATAHGGVVAGVDITFDGGHRWRPANSVGIAFRSWEFKMQWPHSSPPDAALVLSRAVDDCGRIETVKAQPSRL